MTERNEPGEEDERRTAEEGAQRRRRRRGQREHRSGHRGAELAELTRIALSGRLGTSRAGYRTEAPGPAGERAYGR